MDPVYHHSVWNKNLTAQFTDKNVGVWSGNLDGFLSLLQHQDEEIQLFKVAPFMLTELKSLSCQRKDFFFLDVIKRCTSSFIFSDKVGPAKVQKILLVVILTWW